MIAIGSMPNVRIWKRVVGFDRQKGIKYGIPGESDLQGIIAPHGKILAIECKTGLGKLNQDQIRFRDMIIKFGGIYIEARSVEQICKELANHLSGQP